MMLTLLKIRRRCHSDIVSVGLLRRGQAGDPVTTPGSNPTPKRTSCRDPPFCATEFHQTVMSDDVTAPGDVTEKPCLSFVFLFTPTSVLFY